MTPLDATLAERIADLDGLVRGLAPDDDPEGTVCACASCGESYSLNDGCEPTAFCDTCAQDFAARLVAIWPALLADRARLVKERDEARARVESDRYPLRRLAPFGDTHYDALHCTGCDQPMSAPHTWEACTESLRAARDTAIADLAKARAASKVLADFAMTAPGRLPERVTTAIAVARGLDGES